MKVKYQPSNQTLTCSNDDLSITLKIRICEKENNQPLILYDPKDVYNFFEYKLFPQNMTNDLNPNRFQRFLDIFLYQGCAVALDNYMYINVTGLKHFFSSMVSHRVFENSFDNLIDWKCAKFLNWVLNFDFNSLILKTLKIPSFNGLCGNCRKAGLEINMNYLADESEMITKWISKLETKEDQDKYDLEYLAYLAGLFKVAAREIRSLVALDVKNSQIRSLKTPLAMYNPREDWVSTCPIIKLFIDESMTEAQSDLCKVLFLLQG